MSTNIVPISDLRREASQVVKIVREGRDVVYITQHGRPAAVLVNYEQYEALIAELQALKQQQSKTAYTIAEQKGTFATLADMAQDLGADDLAEQHDHYLYGTDKS
ncbi:type II toxin-antitoxin system Phd/YefM family antitoxin [Candidatus Leptofilum sp.]|uniref:type II toxin-antitoxin system Phd/YefM family antitoxin n=1 Tax=Candidatus Leptofilum sp. TaxID=3241576 RepID=UPI003B5CC5F0